MNRQERDDCDLLLRCCELLTDDDIEQYITVIERLKGSTDPDVLRVMLGAFRDTDAGEVQYELVEAAESYPDEVYVKIFIEEGPRFHGRSPQWFRLMFQSLLNSSNCRAIFDKEISRLGGALREFYRSRVEELVREDEDYSSVLDSF